MRLQKKVDKITEICQKPLIARISPPTRSVVAIAVQSHCKPVARFPRPEMGLGETRLVMPRSLPKFQGLFRITPRKFHFFLPFSRKNVEKVPSYIESRMAVLTGTRAR
jgi:hypothetical protein